MLYLFFWLITIVNVACLAIALCLGLYIVTRTPRGWETWLASLTLWSTAGFYLYNSLALTVPANRAVLWLRPSVVFALAFGFHLCLLFPDRRSEPGFSSAFPSVLIPEWLERRLGSAGPVIRRVPVPLSYALAFSLLVVSIIPVGDQALPAEGPALYLSDRAPSLLYPLVVFYLVPFLALACMHYWQAWRLATSRPSKTRHMALLIALLLTISSGIYLGLGVWLRARLPTFPADVFAGIAAVFLGYRVARHNSMKQGLVLRRELLYIALVIGVFTIAYVVIAELLHQGGHAFSALTLIVIVIVGVTTLMLYDGMRSALDRLFYREQFRSLRSNLRALSREASIGQSVPERLQFVLNSVCRTLDIRQAFFALRGEHTYQCQATERLQCLGQTFPLEALDAPEAVELPRPEVPNPEGMALLVPVHAEAEQIGALVVGPNRAGVPFSEEDLIVLEDVADQLGGLISAAQGQQEHAKVISEMVAEFREREHALQRQMQQMLAEREEDALPVLEGVDETLFTELVETALRQLHNFTFLGEYELAQLRVVDWHLQNGDGAFVTHIDRGKAVGRVLVECINKLRPAGKEPDAHAVPPRPWHQFIVLYDAYVLGDLNRNIMSKLYIGEGTFNRTRRRALRGVAKALQEMEQEALLRETG